MPPNYILVTHTKSTFCQLLSNLYYFSPTCISFCQLFSTVVSTGVIIKISYILWRNRSISFFLSSDTKQSFHLVDWNTYLTKNASSKKNYGQNLPSSLINNVIKIINFFKVISFGNLSSVSIKIVASSNF